MEAAELEGYYAAHCPAAKEIRLLPLSEHAADGLRAEVIPDFDYLRRRGIVNAGDTIRFALENLSARRPAGEQIHVLALGTGAATRTSPAAVDGRVLEIVQNHTSCKVIVPSMNLEIDLHIDSLERVLLLADMEAVFGTGISDERAAGILTVGDLIAVVQQTASEASSVVRPTRWSEILNAPLRAEELQHVDILERRPAREALVAAASRAASMSLRLVGGLKVQGLEALPAGGFLLCSNHLSHIDPGYLLSALPRRIVARTFLLGFAEYFRNRWVNRTFKIVPTDPDQYARQALRLGAEGLRRGLTLCVFPEGERSIDGRLKPFRKGLAILAVELGMPVAPVGISGTYQIWSRARDEIRYYPALVRFGRPLAPAAGESYDVFTRRAFQAVEELISPVETPELSIATGSPDCA